MLLDEPSPVNAEVLGRVSVDGHDVTLFGGRSTSSYFEVYVFGVGVPEALEISRYADSEVADESAPSQPSVTVFSGLIASEWSQEPGVESSGQVGELRNLRVESGVVRAEFSVTSDYAEMSTGDPDCYREGTHYARIRKTFDFVYLPGDDCLLVPSALVVLEPGYRTDCQGHRTTEPLDSSVDYELRIEILSEDRVRLTRVSGTPPAAYASRLGERPIRALDTRPTIRCEVLMEESGR